MTTEVEQTYATHRRFHPMYHFFALPILGLNAVFQIWQVAKHPHFWPMWWNALVAIALVIGVWVARVYPLRIQDRLIRLEETARMSRNLPEDLRDRVGELSTGQLIALRFCPDEELPELTRAVLGGEVKETDAIKQRIQKWRADHHRI